jgi:hypothetical protein
VRERKTKTSEKMQSIRVKRNGETKVCGKLLTRKLSQLIVRELKINGCIQSKKKWDFPCKTVAYGYIQVQGIDFDESFAPIMNDVRFRIMLITKLVWDMTCTVVDIEAAFLHGYLDEEIYMEVPKGLTISENKKIILLKTLMV